MHAELNDRPELEFEPLNTSDEWKELEIRRARIAGGWLVLASWGAAHGGLTFVADPNHAWDGGSAP